jgi:hypothetical protein
MDHHRSIEPLLPAPDTLALENSIMASVFAFSQDGEELYKALQATLFCTDKEGAKENNRPNKRRLSKGFKDEHTAAKRVAVSDDLSRVWNQL